MHSRAEHLIDELELIPHPEGGHYREYFRAPERVRPGGDQPERAAMTGIYFLLARGEVSRWHRVAHAEIWCFLEGGPLELWTGDPGGARLDCRILSLPGGEGEPVRVVEAGRWQAAQPREEYTLVSCAVGPGFEFEDFQLLHNLPESAEELKRLHPEAARFL
jgi:predicted cupin superfamily sugar epimerase